MGPFNAGKRLVRNQNPLICWYFAWGGPRRTLRPQAPRLGPGSRL